MLDPCGQKSSILCSELGGLTIVPKDNPSPKTTANSVYPGMAF